MPNKEEKPAELTWAQERAEDRYFEKVRTGIAIAISVIGVSLILFWYCKGNASALALESQAALLAALVATAVVAGARTLEGPDNSQQSRKRSSLPPASQMARSWLSCFIAVAAVILLAQLINRIDPAPEGPADAQSSMTVSGTLSVTTDGGTEYVEIAGRAED